jgi:hypothetical protein
VLLGRVSRPWSTEEGNPRRRRPPTICVKRRSSRELQVSTSTWAGQRSAQVGAQGQLQLLQVMDLIVNSPFKAGARRARCEDLFDYFQAWKIRRLKAERDGTARPPFSPPKPTVADGLQTLITVLNTTLATTKFQTSMQRCFVDVGLAPYNVTDVEKFYRVYTDHKRGSLNPKLWKPEFCMPEGSGLGDVIDACDDMQVVTRLDALDDLDNELGDSDSEVDDVELID